MDPEKAASLGVKPEEVRVETFGGRYGGEWIVFVEDADRRHILTQGNVFYACHWKARLGRIVNGS